MSRYQLLDTCVLNPYFSSRGAKQRPKTVGRVRELLREQRAALGWVTMYELRRGMRVKQLKDEGQAHRTVARLDMFLRDVPVLGLEHNNGEGWRMASELYARLHTLTPAREPGPQDVLIAATSLVWGTTLITADVGFAEWMRALGYGHALELWPVE